MNRSGQYINYGSGYVKITTDLDPWGIKTYGTLALALTDLILNIFVLLLDLKFWYYYLLYIWDQK
jgi:hypothetical protein